MGCFFWGRISLGCSFSSCFFSGCFFSDCFFSGCFFSGCFSLFFFGLFLFVLFRAVSLCSFSGCFSLFFFGLFFSALFLFGLFFFQVVCFWCGFFVCGLLGFSFLGLLLHESFLFRLFWCCLFFILRHIRGIFCPSFVSTSDSTFLTGRFVFARGCISVLLSFSILLGFCVNLVEPTTARFFVLSQCDECVVSGQNVPLTSSGMSLRISSFVFNK